MSMGFGFFLFSSVIFSSPNFFGFLYFFFAQTTPAATAPTERSTDFEKFSGTYSMSF